MAAKVIDYLAEELNREEKKQRMAKLIADIKTQGSDSRSLKRSSLYEGSNAKCRPIRRQLGGFCFWPGFICKAL